MLGRSASPWFGSAALVLACSASPPPAPPAPAPAPVASVVASAAPEPPPNDSTAECNAKRAEAISLANEGDQNVKLNVLRSIELYRDAIEIYPTENRIYWKLAASCEKTEDWPCMVEVLTRATKLAPEFANYWHKLGYALIMLAEAGDASAFERAKPALETCIARDPNVAQCYFLLGEALEWTDHEKEALVAYSNAIRRDPAVGTFYPPLADLYLAFGLRQQAKGVISEGMRVVQPDEKNLTSIYRLHMAAATIARLDGNTTESVREMTEAEKYVGERHPEFAFSIGSIYATMDPPRKDPAIRLLNLFIKRVCRGAASKDFQEQCEIASALVQRLDVP